MTFSKLWSSRPNGTFGREVPWRISHKCVLNSFSANSPVSLLLVCDTCFQSFPSHTQMWSKFVIKIYVNFLIQCPTYVSLIIVCLNWCCTTIIVLISIIIINTIIYSALNSCLPDRHSTTQATPPALLLVP
jgi:hypothetical protein